MRPRNALVILGEIAGLYGVRGWVKVHSQTDPRENILTYSPWQLTCRDAQTHTRNVLSGQRHGKGLIAQLAGCDDRDQAAALIGATIAVPRAQLPPPAADEVYWADLEGVQVVTIDGVALGQVVRLFETGANDVLVVKGERERLIPLVWDSVIQQLDLDSGVMRVDWDPDF